MTRLVAAFMRHGMYCQPAGVPSAHLPHPLTAEGMKQAGDSAALVRRFADTEKLDICLEIDSSNLLRAWQTARLMADQQSAFTNQIFTVEGFDDLAERGLGSAANLTVAEIEAVMAADPRYPSPPPGWKSDSHFRLPLQNAESLMDAGARVARHVTSRLQALAGTGKDTVLKVFVGHGAAMRHAAVHLGVLDLEEMPRLSMFHCLPVFLEYLAGGTWRQIGGEWKVRNLSEAAVD